MKKIMMSALVCWVLGSGWSLAAEPVDNHVKNALLDIARYEKQFAGKTSAIASTVKRSLKLLTLTRGRLDQSPNKSHESWIEADKRYKALVTRLNGFLSPSGSANTQTASKEASATKTPPAPGPPRPMISQYRVRIKKITRDIQSRIDTMNTGGVKPFQDSEYVKTFQQSADRFRESIAKYADFKDDPDVVGATAALAEYENMIKFGRGHAAKELAELGDVQARLRTINQQIRQLRRPPTPQEPYEAGELGQWLTQLATVRPAAVRTYQPLPVIKRRAYLPDNRLTVEQGGLYDLQDVDRLQRSLVGLVKGIDTEVKTFGEHLDRVVAGVKEGLAYYREFDPADRSDQANHFLSAGRADEIRARLAKDKQTATEAAHYAKLINDPAYQKRLALAKKAPATAETRAQGAEDQPVQDAKPVNDPTYQERLALLKEVEATAALYEANYQKARALVRMPKAATEDAELIAIAQRTLANYDYVGDVKRLVINTEKAHRSKETSEEKYDDIDVSLSGTVTLTGTKTTYFYEWDEFQVATAEPVGDAYYIFYTTLKYFTSGATTTPLNKWIVSARLQSCEIPKDNINK
jgi:hypothetical protein